MNEDQVKHMVNRFLGWKLPADFSPDAGISFKADFNEHTAHPMKHEPSGTNLLDARQAEAMIRYLLDGLSPPKQNLVGDGEAAIIECLAAGEPFVFDPATNFLHADDGTVENGIRYVPAPQEHVEGYQGRVAAAHHALFHDDPTDIAERRNRFAEEVNEALQAFGMAEDEAIELVRYTWSRPVGQPEKEVGAAMLTLASLCVVAGIDMAACGEADLEKLQRPETIARIRAKRATRHGRGPLPGLDPALATTEGSCNG